MDWTTWVAPVVSGTVVGGLTLSGVWLTARRRERADGHAEWGRRLSIALREIAAEDSARRQRFGLVMLRSLANDERGSPKDRQIVTSFLVVNAASARFVDGPGSEDEAAIDKLADGTDNDGSSSVEGGH